MDCWYRKYNIYSHYEPRGGGGGYLPQVLVATVKRTAKAVAVTSRDEERWPLYILKFGGGGTFLKGLALILFPLKQDM